MPDVCVTGWPPTEHRVFADDYDRLARNEWHNTLAVRFLEELTSVDGPVDRPAAKERNRAPTGEH